MRYLLIVLILVLTGCTMQSAVALRCDGPCKLDVDRGIDVKAPETR